MRTDDRDRVDLNRDPPHSGFADQESERGFIDHDVIGTSSDGLTIDIDVV